MSISLNEVPRLVSASVGTAVKHLNALTPKEDRAALLLFGSYAYGSPTEYSDVDLLIVGTEVRRSFHDYDAVSIDLVYETSESLRRKLAREEKWNNNFLVNILLGAVLLEDDPQGTGAALLEEARQRWTAGPEKFSRKEAREATLALSIMCRSAKAQPKRVSTYDEAQRALCRMRLDQIVNKSVYLSFKAQRRWSSSFPQSISRLRDNIPELHELWLVYAKAPLEEAQEAANAIASYVLILLAKDDF